MTLSIITLGKITLGIMKLCIMTFCIMTLSMKRHCIKTRHSESSTTFYCYAQCNYTRYRYADCRGAFEICMTNP